MGEYIITRGFQEGKALTNAQRASPLFAEEPVVLGRVLRRGSKPMRLTGADYRANEHKLLALEKAGAIKIQRPEEKAMPVPCSKCGQVPRGQGGEFKCPLCGLPTVTDMTDVNPSTSGAGDAPAPQEAAGAVQDSAVAAPPADPPAVIVPPPPETQPTPPPAEEPPPPPPAPEPVPAEEPVVEKKEEDAPAPAPSAPKPSSKSKKGTK